MDNVRTQTTDKVSSLNPLSSQEQLHRVHDDEIDLFDLIFTVMRYKWFLLISCLAGLLLGGLYAILVIPTYTYSVTTAPPEVADIIGSQVSFFDASSSSDVYRQFVTLASAPAFQWNYFTREALYEQFNNNHPDSKLSNVEVFNTWFLENLTLDSDDSERLSITFVSTSPDQSKQIVDRYIDYAQQITLDKMLANIEAVRAKKLTELDQLIDNTTLAYEAKVEDQKARLKEALFIARKLDLKRPQQVEAVNRGEAAIAINTSSTPLYFRGSIALQAELDNLNERKNHEAHIAGLRKLQEQRYNLESEALQTSRLAAMQTVSDGNLPYETANQSWAFFLAIGGLIGLLGGIIIMILREVIQDYQKKTGLAVPCSMTSA